MKRKVVVSGPAKGQLREAWQDRGPGGGTPHDYPHGQRPGTKNPPSPAGGPLRRT
jgi:hypothetical protein